MKCTVCADVCLPRQLVNALILHCSEDRASLNKLVETVKTNYNERAEEVNDVLYYEL